MDARCTHRILLANTVRELTLGWNAASGDLAYFAYFAYLFQIYRAETPRANNRQLFFQRAEGRLLRTPTYTTARIKSEKVCKECKFAHSLMK